MSSKKPDLRPIWRPVLTRLSLCALVFQVSPVSLSLPLPPHMDRGSFALSLSCTAPLAPELRKFFEKVSALSDYYRMLLT